MMIRRQSARSDLQRLHPRSTVLCDEFSNPNSDKCPIFHAFRTHRASTASTFSIPRPQIAWGYAQQLSYIVILILDVYQSEIIAQLSAFPSDALSALCRCRSVNYI